MAYGRLYTWDAARSACTSGFRLPTHEDYENLWTAAGADFNAGFLLKTTYGWKGDTNGNDTLKFSPCLDPNFAVVTLTTTPNANIWANGVYKGTGTWTGKLTAGVYDLEAREIGYTSEPITREIVVKPQIDTIEIPAPMLETQKERMIDEFAQQLMYQGLSFDQYAKFTGATKEKMMEQVEPQAETRIRTRLVLEAVAEAEKLEASDADYEEELKTMADAYGKDVDEIKKDITEDVEKMIKDDLKVRAAAKFLADNAKEK